MFMQAVSEANRRPVVSHLPPKQPAPPLPPTPNTMPHSNPLAANYLTCRCGTCWSDLQWMHACLHLAGILVCFMISCPGNGPPLHPCDM
jgi:hypothetical protein